VPPPAGATILHAVTPRRVLLTGAFGNIGRNTLPQLLERGHAVRALLFDERKERRLARAFAGKVEVVQGDVRDRAAMERAVAGVDDVLHLAYFLPPPAWADPERAKTTNVDGTRTLLEAVKATAPKARFFFASSLDVYGPTTHLPPPRRVGDPLQAIDNYAAHKIECEAMVQASGLSWSIFRFADVPPIELRGPVPAMFKIPLQTRIEMIHPRDAGLAVAKLLETDAAWGRILNIGGGPRCQLLYRDYLGGFLEAMGIGRLPEEAFSHAPYCTDWLDTEESQRLLEYQRSSYADVVAETAALLGWRAPLARLARPVARWWILRMSPQWRARGG